MVITNFPVPLFSPETWSVNHQHQHQMMPMHPHGMPSSWSTTGETIHDTTHTADDATHDYPYYTYQSE